MPQAQRVPLLERVLTVIIGNALILAGLCMYHYLVEIYESHWLHPTPTHLGVANWPTSCVYHARWAPIDSDLFRSQAWFTLPAADFQTLFLLSQDRHASGVVYSSQSADAVAVADIEVEVEAFYESEADDAPGSEGIGICVLRWGQGQYGIDVLVSTTTTCGTPA
ncbi:hypothetical protein BC827DRAFT_235398 [Russula dissimulans]|nr:hypothetical protein BC827DRAFT_235398 [Russula dissimulans]